MKPAAIKLLIQICWLLWGLLALFALYGLFLVSTELVMAARRQSPRGLIALLIVLLYPLVMLIAQPAVRAYKNWKWAGEEARNDGTDPQMNESARKAHGSLLLASVAFRWTTTATTGKKVCAANIQRVGTRSCRSKATSRRALAMAVAERATQAQ